MAAPISFIRLRGLPFTATEQDVAQWFHQVPGAPVPQRIVFGMNAAGRKSGEAFVELPENMAERAQQMLNHRNMGNRYVEVFVSCEADASSATNAAHAMQHQPPQQQAPTASATPWQHPVGENGAQQVPGAGGGLVRMRGLPFSATVENVLAFFQGYTIPNGGHGVHMVLGQNGRSNGECFVEFASEEIAEAALQRDRGVLGTRYVELFRATPEQMAAAHTRSNKSNNMAPAQQQAGYAYGAFSMPGPMAYGGGGAPPQMAGPGMESVLKMRGLPYKVTRNDIIDFFTGLSVPLNGVHLMFNEREQPTGEAYVEFNGPEDREKAMVKDRQHIDGRYIELFRANRAEMLQALEEFVGGYMKNNMQMPAGGMAGGAPYGNMQPYQMQQHFGQPAFPMGGPACAGGPGHQSQASQMQYGNRHMQYGR